MLEQGRGATNSSSQETKVTVNEVCLIRVIGSTRAKHQPGRYILYFLSVQIGEILGNLCFLVINWPTMSPWIFHPAIGIRNTAPVSAVALSHHLNVTGAYPLAYRPCQV